jgi:hypothetical protein
MVTTPLHDSLLDAPAGSASGDDEQFAPQVLAVVGVLSVLPAVISAQVALQRLPGSWGDGALFLGVAIAQLLSFCAIARRPTTLALQAGLWTATASVVAYLVSRTAGLPVGPDGGAVQDVDASGVVAALADAALVVVLASLLGARARRWTLNVLALVGVVLWGAALAGALTPSSQPAAEAPALHVHPISAGGVGDDPAPLPVIPDSVRNAPRTSGAG